LATSSSLFNSGAECQFLPIEEHAEFRQASGSRDAARLSPLLLSLGLWRLTGVASESITN
jgi:hypothetical protein